MPLPFLVWAAAAAVGGLGAVGHAVARDDQKEAERIAQRAKDTYESAKKSLETCMENMNQSLLSLGRSKKNVYDTSMTKFIRNYERIQNIPNKNFPGMDELRNFRITPEDMIQLRRMSSIYEGSLAAGAGAGTAAGLMALAANGSLTTVGGALMTGSIGTALTGIGSLAASPFAVVAAPVMFFTALSASFKADENKEKARLMLAEANEKAEKMKTNETLCRAIGERADMFDTLLVRLDGMFSQCAGKLEDLVFRKAGYDFSRKIQGYELNDSEINLCFATASLAKAVMSVLNTPILTKDGTNVNPAADSTIDKLNNGLSALTASFIRV